MKVAKGGSFGRCLILNTLEFEDVGGRRVGKPDGGSICEDRADEELVGE